MKKITYYFSMIFMAVMMLSLTSCDEDADIAYALNGNWKGYMQTQLDYDGRYYQSNMSEVTFNSGYDSGDGYWIDYYSNARLGLCGQPHHLAREWHDHLYQFP